MPGSLSTDVLKDSLPPEQCCLGALISGLDGRLQWKFWYCSQREDVPSLNLNQPDMKYLHNHVSFFSSVTLWWVNWLLQLGYKKHLELSDLGIADERHEARFNHERFCKAFLEELESAKRSGKHASLMKVYARVYDQRLLWAAVVKLIGELVSLICPITGDRISGGWKSLGHWMYIQVSQGHHVTLEEFYKNDFVVVFIMFLASFVSSLCSENCNHRGPVSHVTKAVSAMVA
ncbi:ABC transporter C family member 8-like [Asterias amurensis]|uniref:ABC transporter C family member 8-like n=1 Tax=Asterias amurensis TaxID=7602 RepID=UPI003AB5FA26